jgi:hypothetical protein
MRGVGRLLLLKGLMRRYSIVEAKGQDFAIEMVYVEVNNGAMGVSREIVAKARLQ